MSQQCFKAGRHILFLPCLLLLSVSLPALAQVKGDFLYTLSNFGGVLRYDYVRVNVDLDREETYVLFQNLIRVFNASGMEIFSFGDDLDLGQIVDAVVDQKGDVILLSYKDSKPLVTRCNFRGKPVGSIEIMNLPEGVAFAPNRMIYRNRMLYFASLSGFKVYVTDTEGELKKYIDLTFLLEQEVGKKVEGEMIGFSVDGEGNIFFTIPVFFKAYKLSPDGKIASFGRPGSAPGRFGIVAGIVADSHGNVIVVDKLKCTIMIFDKDFSFITEFGYRGLGSENLIVPDDIAIDKRDRIYVTQGRKRGVSVFALSYDQ